MTGDWLSELEVRYLFPTPVMVMTMPDASSLNAALKDAILARRASSDGVKRSNIHGWHSDSEMLRWAGEAAKTLALRTLEVCASRIEDVALKGGAPRFEFGIEMWANVSPPGASNQAHTHPGSLWSAVYYVDDGGDPDASLVLIDPNYPLNRMIAPDLQFVGRSGEKFPTQELISPAPGRLVLFPSWLNHSVKPNNGPRDRISIAMNILALPVRPAMRAQA